jgi:hypothetical protein
MSNEHKTLAMRALENMRGDDLYRARAAFSNLTDAELDLQHGYSGKTRREILAEYEEYEAKINAAIEWMKTK